MAQPPTPHRFPGRPGDWVVHKDNQILAFNKPAGLAVQPDRKNSPNLLQIGAAYAHRDLYLVHRLDRPVSGVVVFGKKPSAQTKLTEQFQARSVEKLYLAVVANRPPEDEAAVFHHLTEHKHNRSEVSDEKSPTSKRAELHYKLLGSSDRYHLLAVQLKTGRKHQIRAQLAALGCPVRGDEKYGFKRANPGPGIDLHAYRISFDHPTSNQRVTLTAPVPDTPVWAAFTDLLP